VNINEYGAMLHEKDGRAIGFSESPRDGRSTAATLDAETRLKFAVSGSSPQGEEDTLHVCCVLAERLRQDDASWTDPELAAGQLDCVIRHRDQRRTMNVQVVRAIVDQAYGAPLILPEQCPSRSLSPKQSTRSRTQSS
jgi:hypothetical protein